MSQIQSDKSARDRRLQRLKLASPSILPSMLLCDFGNLEKEIDALRSSSEVDCLHLDVMDGVFVPNMTYGMPIASAFRNYAPDMLIDAHLMIADPAKYVPQFIDCGVDAISFHIEAFQDDLPGCLELLQEIQSNGVVAGLAINPSTEFENFEDVGANCDFMLVMSVEAGFGGQKFNPIALDRTSRLKKRYGSDLLLQIDGGINLETIASARKSGSDLFVVGSAIFGRDDYSQAIDDLICQVNS